jgi:hypothetical protein
MIRRRVAIFLALPLLACAARRSTDPSLPGALSPPASGRASALEGAWRVVEQASRVPGGSWSVTEPPHRSLHLFTGTHYSYMFTRPEPRQLFSGDPNQPSEAEKVRAYDSFVAASGTYEFDGSTLTTRAILHKNPNEMTGGLLRYAVEISGDTVRLTIMNPPFQPGRERRTVLTRIP